MNAGKCWIDFWNHENSIYISREYTRLYYRALAAGVRDALGGKLGRPPLTLLDFGAGHGLATREFIAAGMRVWLYDPTPRMEAGLRQRFDGMPDVRVLGTGAYDSLPDGSVDAILMFSVLQYVEKRDAPELMRKFRRILKDDGVLLIGDIVSSQSGVVADTFSLLKRALWHGFFISAVVSLGKTYFSDYKEVRDQSGFATYEEEEIVSLLSAAGFDAVRIPNVGFDQARMAIRGAARQ